jgi:hypothetical protein
MTFGYNPQGVDTDETHETDKCVTDRRAIELKSMTISCHYSGTCSYFGADSPHQSNTTTRRRSTSENDLDIPFLDVSDQRHEPSPQLG